MNEMRNENLTQSALEVAKHSSISVSLSGWPAAATLISIPTSVGKRQNFPCLVLQASLMR